MRWRMSFLSNGESTQMGLFRFGKTPLVRIENGEIIQD